MKAALAFSLAGKVVLITGAGGGIGLAAAQALASSGARLMLSDVDAARGEAVLADFHALGLDARFAVCDVTQADSVRNLI